MITFVIPGKPFGKQRPRATKGGHIYTPKETVSFEQTVGQIAMRHFAEPLEGPVSVTIRASFQPGKSLSKKETARRLNRPHTFKPDLDNCAKAILDALNRIAWADDGQVAEITVSKVWGPKAQTVVHVESLQTEGAT